MNLPRWRSHAGFLALLGSAAVGCDPDPADPPGDDTAADDDGADDDTLGDDDSTPPPFVEDPVRLVDPFIGTGGLGFGVGSAFPGPSWPHGMTQPCPDTSTASGLAPGFAHCAGYWHEDTHIEGFSQWRLHGVGVADGGTITLMPVSGMDESRTDADGTRQAFSHEREEATPGYYRVVLDDTGIEVELAASEHAAIHRYTFPEGTDPVVVLDATRMIGENTCAGSRVDVGEGGRLLEGFTAHQGGLTGRGGGAPVYHSIAIDPAPVSFGTWVDGVMTEGGTRAEGASSAGAWVSFPPGEATTVTVAVGLSWRSVEAARQNRETEAGTFDFDGMRQSCEDAWRAALGVVQVAGGDEAWQRIFYTALYHTWLMPRTYTDADGFYPGFDGMSHDSIGDAYYNDFSLWDTYRTWHPLVALLTPDRASAFARSLVTMYQQGGAFPQWPAGLYDSGSMVGDSAAIAIADAWLRGARDFDIETAWDGLVASADGTAPAVGYGGRDGIAGYIERGWCDTDTVSGAVSVTQEYAADDFALAALARDRGDTEAAERFDARAVGWTGLWDAEAGFLNGRAADGTFMDLDDPTVWYDWYVEAGAWQSTWGVPGQPEALASILGGDEGVVAKLDEFFALSQAQEDTLLYDPYYWHGNEPDLATAWLYLDAGRPDRAAETVRWIAGSKYRDTPDGLDGNDDAGALSAWAVLSALGLYPIAGTDQWWLGFPLFPRAVIHHPSGDLVIEAPGAPDSYRTESVARDGAPLEGPRIAHGDLLGGVTLTYTMGGDPGGGG